MCKSPIKILLNHPNYTCKTIVNISWNSCIPRCHSRDVWYNCATLVQSWCGGGTYWGLSWICLWLLMGGSVALVLNSSPFFRVSRICSVSVNAQTNNTMELYHHAQPTPWNQSRDVGNSQEPLVHITEQTGMLRTFFGKPSRLRPYADWSTVLLILRWAT